MAAETDVRHVGCVWQVVARCNKQCKPAEECMSGRPVLRSRYRGGGGHHHLEQEWKPGDLEKKPTLGPSVNRVIVDFRE